MGPRINSISLKIDDRTVAGIVQRDHSQANQPKMLCVHGWLDNANSFVPLMPHLPAFEMVAIDLPGHGYSDPLPGGYSLHEMIYQISQIAKTLEWEQYHLAGHSLGAGIAPMVAVAQPECVQSLILIESSGPLSENASELPNRLQKSLDDRLNSQRFESRRFDSKDEAVAVRLKAANMSQAAARLIIDRQLQQTDEGFGWRFDPRWRMASPQYQTEEQVLAILSAVNCPVLTVLAEEGYLVNRPTTGARLDALKNRKSTTIAGHHHVHMDTPEPVAAAINQFLDATPALGG